MGLLRILYRDKRLVAIDKPERLLVHRTRLARDHTFALQLLRDQIGQFVYPLHRLDRATSGVLVFALDPESARAFCELFASRQARKEYIAVVRGFTDETGRIEHALREEKGAPEQEAVTEYTRLATAELPVPVGPHASARYALVRAEPHTGRMHQIRKHFKHISHPLIGDTQHGDGRHNRLFRERFGCRRLLLHAQRITLPHPTTGHGLTIEAPVPAEMTSLFTELGWQTATT